MQACGDAACVHVLTSLLDTDPESYLTVDHVSIALYIMFLSTTQAQRVDRNLIVRG